MLDKLLALVKQAPSPTADTVGAPFQRRELAVAVLLLELAQSDRTLSPEELDAIRRIVSERFGLDPEAAAQLIDAAKMELDAALEDWVFADAVRTGFERDERAEIVALLWEVVYADGRLARFEEALMRRLAAELDVGQAECDNARARAFARVGGRRAGDNGSPQAE